MFIAADISDRTSSIEAKGRIIYSVPQLGAGVLYLDLTPELIAQLASALRPV